MLREPLIEDGMAVGFGRAVFEGARQHGEQVCAAEEESFGALCDELWRGRGGVEEGCWECWPGRCC